MLYDFGNATFISLVTAIDKKTYKCPFTCATESVFDVLTLLFFTEISFKYPSQGSSCCGDSCKKFLFVFIYVVVCDFYIFHPCFLLNISTCPHLNSVNNAGTCKHVNKTVIIKVIKHGHSVPTIT